MPIRTMDEVVERFINYDKKLSELRIELQNKKKDADEFRMSSMDDENSPELKQRKIEKSQAIRSIAVSIAELEGKMAECKWFMGKDE